MTKSKFDLFIGVDWSGAKGKTQKGIQVAVAKLGKDAPQTICPPNPPNPRYPKRWSREAVLAYIIDEAKKLKGEGKKVLVGFDFAFAYPFSEGGYYPGLKFSPSNADAMRLWQIIEEMNDNQKHLYGGAILKNPKYRPYYCTQKGSGNECDLKRFRRTEKMAKERHDCRPSPTFKCVGGDQVGTGSLAGMRMLSRLVDEASIWPIVEMPESNLTVVEIFPKLYFSMAGVSDKEKKDDPLSALNTALVNKWQSQPVENLTEGLPDNDDVDALISTAALRSLCKKGLPKLPPQIMKTARREGWILGVKPPKETP